LAVAGMSVNSLLAFRTHFKTKTNGVAEFCNEFLPRK
jgi:hypothetical protein